MGIFCNKENSNNIIISFKDRTDKIKCTPQMTFEEIIKKYLNVYLNNQYDFEKLTLTINGVICYPDKTLEWVIKIMLIKRNCKKYQFS